jgi:hypothetical protein
VRSRVLPLLLAVVACGRKETTPPPSSDPPPAVVDAELALQVSDSVAIWFTSARTDTSAEGTACRERVMEIRVRDRAIPVPLLYTGEVPTITTDSTVEVHIWRHCVPADLYRVNLKTGQPTRAGA